MQPGMLNQQNYKSIKCRYNEVGLCKYGENCHYAHSDAEMRPAVDK